MLVKRIELSTLTLAAFFGILPGFVLAHSISSAQGAPQATPTALTNEDVIKMVQAKLGEAVILAKIRSSPCKFDTSTDALIKLKGAGVSDAILQAMTEASASLPPGVAPLSVESLKGRWKGFVVAPNMPKWEIDLEITNAAPGVGGTVVLTMPGASLRAEAPLQIRKVSLTSASTLSVSMAFEVSSPPTKTLNELVGTTQGRNQLAGELTATTTGTPAALPPAKGRFELTRDQAGVPPPQSVMTAVAGSAATGAPTQTASPRDPNDPMAPHDPGIYLYENSKMIKLAWRLAAVAGRGAALSGMTFGAKKYRVSYEISGSRAAVRTNQSQPNFYVYYSEFQSPTTEQVYDGVLLMSLKQKGDRRELVVAEGRPFGGPTMGANRIAAPKSVLVDNLVEQVGPHTFKLAPKGSLPPGEYAFYGQVLPMGGGGGGSVLDFGVDTGPK